MIKQIAQTRLVELEAELDELKGERTKNETEEATKQARIDFTIETINTQRSLLGMTQLPSKKNMPFIDPNED